MPTILAVVLVVSGCATSRIGMKPEERQALATYSRIDVVHYTPPPLSAMTPGKAAMGGLFGMVGAIGGVSAAASQGKTMTEKYGLEDPALRTKARLLSTLQVELGLANFHPVQDPLEDDDVDALRRRFGTSTVLDFKTTGWRLAYYPTDWSHYRVVYAARSRLIRLADSAVIWQGACEVVGNDRGTSPTMEELTANNGEILKVKLAEAADACADQLSAQFLGTAK